MSLLDGRQYPRRRSILAGAASRKLRPFPSIERARSYVAHPQAWTTYAGGSFDAAFSFAVLNSVDAWRKVLSEVFRVLKPGGVFSFKESIRPASLVLPSRLFLFLPVITVDEPKQHLNPNGLSH